MEMTEKFENGMGRREFGKLSGWAIFLMAIGASVFETGCGIMDTILAWVPVGLNAFSGILTVLSGAGIVIGPGPAAIITLIKAGFSDVTLAIQQYEAIKPPPAGALAKIDAVLNLLVQNFQNFLTSINIQNSAVATLVIGLAEVILTTISGFVAALPASTPMPLTKVGLARQVRIGGHTLNTTPVKNPSIHQFKKDWNKAAGTHSEIFIK
jgi:hypothetical protein